MEDAFVSIRKECREPIECTVTGNIPKWLSGSLYRNGMGKYEYGRDRYDHWLDGSALVQRYSFRDGQVWYQCQLIKGEEYKRNMAAQRIVVPAMGTRHFPDPCKTIFKRYLSYYFSGTPVSGNTNVSFLETEDCLYAMTDTTILNRIDPQTLDTEEKVNLNDYLAIHVATAHPHIDEEGTYFNLGTKYGRPTEYCVVKMTPKNGSLKPPEKIEIVAKVPASDPLKPAYIHTFGFTENYVILIEQPMGVNILKLLMVTKDPPIHAMDFDMKKQAIFHIIDRKTGERLEHKCVTEGFFYAHICNSYQEGNCLIVDVCCTEDPNMIEKSYFHNLTQVLGNGMDELVTGELRRFVLPIHVGQDSPTGHEICRKDNAKATKMESGDLHLEADRSFREYRCEFPRLNEKFDGKPYRFAYTCFVSKQGDNKLMKMDLVEKSVKVWQAEDTKKLLPGEPVFVETPGGEEEDDGVILAQIISDKKETRSYLLVLDAKTFTEIGRASQDLEVNIPYGTHGLYSHHFKLDI